MKNKKFTTWSGIVEFNMNTSRIKKIYCIAKSIKGAREELERLAMKETPKPFRIIITDVKPDTK